MEKNSIVVHVDISYEVYRNFLVFYLLRKSTLHKIILIKILTLLVIIPVFIILYVLSRGNNPYLGLEQMGLTLILPTIFIIILISPLINLRKKYENDKQMNHPQIYTIDNNGFEFKGEGFQVYRTWEEIKKVSLTKKWCIIWINNNMMNFFPIEFLNSEQVEELKAILKQHSSVKKDF